MERFKLILGVVLLAAALIVVMLNTQPITLRLLFTEATMPLALFSLILLGLGFLGGMLTALRTGRKRTAQKEK